MSSSARPQTPVVISDDASDNGSLSDLESGWTDISSNRSGRRSSVISDGGDSEDAHSIIDRFDGEMWEDSEPEDNGVAIDENVLVADEGPSGHIVPPLSAQDTGTNAATDAPLITDSITASVSSLSNSTPATSVRSSRATLRLAFPDPLTSSNEDLFPTPSPDSIPAADEQVPEQTASGNNSQGSSFVEVQAGQSSFLAHWEDEEDSVAGDDIQDDVSLSEIDRLENHTEDQFEPAKPVSWSTSPVYVAVFLLLVVPSAFWAFRNGAVSSSLVLRKSLYPRSILPAPSPSQPPAEAPEETIPSRALALSPASFKSLAVSVFKHETKEAAVVPEEKCGAPFTEVASRRNNPKSIAASPTLLTLDPPATKSLSLLPTFTSADRPLPGGTDKSADAHIAGSFNALSVRITQALSPLFTVVSKDLQELIDAIDMFLESVLRLQDSAARGVGGFVQQVSRQAKKGLQEISKQASEGLEGFSKQASNGVQELTSKVMGVVQTVGERTSYRHARAKENARKVRETGARVAHQAQEDFGRAGDMLKDRMSKSSRAERRLLRAQARERRREARRAVWRERMKAGKAKGQQILDVVAWH